MGVEGHPNASRPKHKSAPDHMRPVPTARRLSAGQVAQRWRFTLKTLANWRWKGRGPTPLPRPSGASKYRPIVFYDTAAILAYENEHYLGPRWDSDEAPTEASQAGTAPRPR